MAGPALFPSLGLGFSLVLLAHQILNDGIDKERCGVDLTMAADAHGYER